MSKRPNYLFSFTRIGPWSAWLFSFLFIFITLNSTRHLPSLRENKNAGTINQTSASRPSVTIFSVLSSVDGSTSSEQSLAIKSWLALSPDLNVVLFGRDPSIFSFTSQFGERVRAEVQLDFTFLGTPFFHSMLARARAVETDISILMDPGIVLFSGFIRTLHYAHKLTHDWLLIAKPQILSKVPHQLDNTEWILPHKDDAEFSAFRKEWSANQMLMAWNSGKLPFHAGILPPFLWGKGFHSEWIISEALSSDFRFVFDASEVISGYSLENLGLRASKISKNSKAGNLEDRSWEYIANSNLAALYGSFYFHRDNFTDNLMRLVRCDKKYIFVHTASRLIYNFQEMEMRGMKFWKGLVPLSRRMKWKTCIGVKKIISRNVRWTVPELHKMMTPLLLPFSLESLLEVVADERKTVVLGVAGNNYQDMLMSWICRLRQLLITNFVVCALDSEVYHFSVVQGLPVFMSHSAANTLRYNSCHFSTECFRKVTKVKSQTVLHILKLGYNVLLSDVDIYWFKNPLPYLHTFGPCVLAAQSDEYNATLPINLPHRLNSGFYFARSDNSTIAAMKKVVKHASTSGLSEQPSFYDALCGENGANRVGEDRCIEPEAGLTVHFLDRALFPNGAYQGLWDKKHVRKACIKKGCMILHNNWIAGRRKKLYRQILSGLWEYDPGSRLCLKSR